MSCVRFLDQHGINYRLYRHDQAFDAQHMAQALHVPGKSVAKTVMARVRGGSRYFVLVVPAPHRIDWNRVSGALGGIDIELADESQIVEHCPDCASGVVPLFGSQYGLQTIVDETVAKQDEIVIQGDTHDEAVRLRFSDFYAVEHPKVAAIAQAHESQFVS
jgi:Ala-tRNA(Pro) deacylase